MLSTFIALVRPIVGVRGLGCRDLLQHVVAFDQFAEGGVLPVEETSASPRQMKNWLPAESGSCERAIESTPRSCDFLLNSALIL